MYPKRHKDGARLCSLNDFGSARRASAHPFILLGFSEGLKAIFRRFITIIFCGGLAHRGQLSGVLGIQVPSGSSPYDSS